ncbi:hypothetical protein C0J52_15008 [Blattella germanica]|nr:hypothetical protein C0J52_15008 [Blattella germanica]
MVTWQYMYRHIAMANASTDPMNQEEILDRETGEHVHNWSTQRTFTTSQTNAETGEIEQTPVSRVSPERRKTFQVPKKALQNYRHQTSQLEQNNNLILPDFLSDDTRKMHYYYPVSIERKFFQDNQNISPILFLLPTIFLFPFPAWLTVISLIVEITLHMWAHKTNRKCNDPHLLYRSPLHILTSQFCALCKSKRYMEKIGQLQDARALKVYSRKPIYVERVSVMT